MKGREVSVSVSQLPDELFVQVTFRLPGHVLQREIAGMGTDTRVRESSRKAKAKELRKLLEGVEFPES